MSILFFFSTSPLIIRFIVVEFMGVFFLCMFSFLNFFWPHIYVRANWSRKLILYFFFFLKWITHTLRVITLWPRPTPSMQSLILLREPFHEKRVLHSRLVELNDPFRKDEIKRVMGSVSRLHREFEHRFSGAIFVRRYEEILCSFFLNGWFSGQLLYSCPWVIAPHKK